MHEEIVSFVRDERHDEPFFLEMAGISYCDGTYRIERKGSPLYVFEYILQGKGVVRTDGKGFVPEAGDVYMLHEGSDHQYASDTREPWIKIWCNVRGPVAAQLVRAYGLSALNHAPAFGRPECFWKIYRIAQRYRGERQAALRESALALHELLIQIASFLRQNAAAADPDAARLKEYLDASVYAKRSMDDIARQAYRSPSQAIRLFKKEYGTTPYQYLLERRIETAKLLLLNTNLQVREIAARLRFADEHYFSNCFKVRAGASPSAFRAGRGG